MLIEPTDSGLYCAAGDFYIDPWKPVERAVITHAHGDHLTRGSRNYLCSIPSQPLLLYRLGADAGGHAVNGPPTDADSGTVTGLAYGDSLNINGVRVSLHPAGHILGSAQVRVEHRGEVWVFSGDFKRAADPTCEPFEPQRCHTFITEATFALPIFRWAPPAEIVQEICAWWNEMRDAGRPAVLFGYGLGKAQRLLAELAGCTDRRVYVHGSLESANAIYRQAGVRMVETARATDEARGRSFAGELVVAPLSARGSIWMRRFGDHASAFASGWMRIRGARRRRAYDRGFALSDHADWPALIDTVRDTGAERVFVTHGYTAQLARYLSAHSLEAHGWRTQYEGEPEATE